MEQKIQKEFSFFQKTVTSDQITVCLQNLKGLQGIEAACLVRIFSVTGAVGYEPQFPLISEQLLALENFLSALELICSITEMPDFDLILCLGSNFDRPLLLTHTSVPIFAVSKERHNNKIILIPRLWNSEREDLFNHLNCEWEKKKEIAFWRGCATDGTYGFYNWDFNPRAHLALMSRDLGLMDAALVPSSAIDASIQRWLKNLSLCSSFVFPEEQSLFKYLVSLDGKGSPSSFEWQMFSRSLIFKSDSNRIEWFYDLLQPGIHYIPFHPDGDDLPEKILWAKSNDQNARTIAENSFSFAKQHLLDEEVLVYLFHILMKYGSFSFSKNLC